MIFHCCSQKEYSFILKLCIYITEDMTFLNKRLIQCASFYLCWYILWKVPVNLLLIEGLSFMFWGVAQWIKAFSKNWKAAVLNPSVCVHVFVCGGGGTEGEGGVWPGFGTQLEAPSGMWVKITKYVVRLSLRYQPKLACGAPK